MDFTTRKQVESNGRVKEEIVEEIGQADAPSQLDFNVKTKFQTTARKLTIELAEVVTLS